CRAHRPATPVSLLSDDPHFPPAELDLAALHVQKVIHKPIDAIALAGLLIPTTVFELDKAIELSRKDQTDAGGTAALEDDEMHAIEAESFLCGSVSYFDVFVKLSDKKYIKILKAKDQFDVERVGSYLKKGVRHFYIRKEAQLFFLQFCDKLTEAILNKADIAPEIKQAQVQNLGRETSALLRSIGISETSVLSAVKFVEHSHKLTRSLDLKDAPKLAQFINQLKESDHCAGTSMIVSMLLEAFSFQDPEVISVISLGAFLHDVGLHMLPNNLGERDYVDLSDEEKAEFEKHPILGADLVSKVPMINPLVTQIVRQHHERRNRKGYPSKLGPGSIAPMAEIIGISDAFQELIARAVKNPDINPLAEMEQTQFDNFSFQTVEGFRKAFLVAKK
ncbi:MAG: HD-GYP domain-containing protein, partial [Bdellovibrionota bacterium]